MRAQVSSEFMVVYTALLLIFVAVYTIYFGGNLNLAQIQESVSVQRNAEAAAAALNYVYLAGDGASYNLTMSNMADSENVSISNFSVTSERPHAFASAPILDGLVNASSIGRGTKMLTNKRGEIDIGD